MRVLWARLVGAKGLTYDPVGPGMSNGTSDGERRDDAFVERLGDRISATPSPPRAPPPPGRVGAPRLGTASGAAPIPVSPSAFGDESTTLSKESEPPPPIVGTLPPAEESGLYEGPAMPQPPPSGPEDAFAEFESTEMPGESTRIEESEIIADQSTAILDEGPKMPFLFVESGKDKGKEYVLQEGETGVGRGIDNDVILTDVSVSRKHLRVLRDGPNLVLRDLGSGNGTTVNGQRVHQIALVAGDRIELGETVLVVRQPTDAPKTTAPPVGSTHETSLPVAGPAPAMIPAWSSPQPPPISGSAENVAPRDGHTATVRLPRRTLALAIVGIAAVALLVGVGVGGMILVAGRGAGDAVPIGPVATPTITPVVAPVGRPPVPPPPTTGVATAPTTFAPATGVPSTAVAVAPPITDVVAPPASVALAPPDTSVAPPVTAAPPVTVASAPPVSTAPVDDAPGRTPRTGRTPRGTRPSRESTSSVMASALARVTTAYNGGDFDGAAAIARDAARHTSGAEQHTLETLANNIDSFAGLYPRIRSAGDALGPVAGTIPIALRLDRQIVSGGHYAREIQPRYVRYLVTQARAQISSAPQTACPRVRDALELDGSNTDAQALERQCETAAARMLSDAQSREHSDAAGAQRTYQAVQQMVPRTSATFRTAGERLSAMRRTTTRTVDEDE